MRKIVEKYFKENFKEIIIFSLVILLGIIIGIIALNNSNDTQKQEIIIYITQFKDNIKSDYSIDYTRLLGESIKTNTILVVSMLFFSLSIIGIPIIYVIVVFKGFSLGYTISSIILTFGIGKGILSGLTLLLINQMISIPCIIILAIEGKKFCKSIIYYRDFSNIKSQILKNLITFLIILGILFISSLVETYLCSNLFLSISKYL